jgi:YceI-like domain
VFKNLVFGALALMLAACGALQARHALPQDPAESASRPDLTSRPDLSSPGRVYRIDGSQSELRILIYRAGPLARFGHNHVMVNHALRGAANLMDAASASSFWLKVPAADFVVDDAQARREEGPDFAGEIADDAKSGTLLNMLSTAVLDADEFPLITVDSIAIADAQGAAGTGELIATVAISLTGHETIIQVPFTFQSDSRRLSASGSLELRQSAIGVTPFSLMLGALQVQDQMRLKFKIVAIAG